jgi:hypothetical protein
MKYDHKNRRSVECTVSEQRVLETTAVSLIKWPIQQVTPTKLELSSSETHSDTAKRRTCQTLTRKGANPTR